MARIVDNTNQLTSPVWAGDYLDRDGLVPGGARLDAAQFYRQDSVLVTTTAQANAAATSIAVSALSGAIPSGTVLYFGETGELARLSANAAAGATSLAVDAIPSQIESGDTARYDGVSATRTVPSGTLLGRTITERDANTGFGPWASGDEEVYLLALDVTDPSVNPDCELYRNFRIVKENFLPSWANWTSGMKTALRAAYRCTKGTP
jgi:hypothetical protein